MLKKLVEAAGVAMPSVVNDRREFWLGCIGIRKDGAIVSSKNGPVNLSLPQDKFVKKTSRRNIFYPTSHAEGRVLRKLGYGGILYVARVSRLTGGYTIAKPCEMCATRIKSKRVEKVYYTISNKQYGVWHVKKDIHVIHEA